MKDIESRADLEVFTRAFYNHLLADERVSYIFTDVAKINLEEHLPKITDFWELSIFHTGPYHNNPMHVHMELNDKEQLTAAHFDVWLGHFNKTVDELFVGSNAEKIKTRAVSIATIMKIKVSAF
ncbi:group III truncated hemoglobin [Flavobacterium sp. DG1-102-2]|uniref:group III truncated hemoglobin n=1 Tax=Flavobacterium sp. DG1-102-2 TaxID=3081663 RepID=UPI002948D1E4|nr:group III truncated hemoglobin [Flavobacterium sp. DG1-102-2]MDV6168260.1 group III truncated hemoglobin [Flavobacterium sp. DG1-102-2]